MNKNYFIFITIIAWGIGSCFTKLAANQLNPIVMSIITTSLYVITLPVILSFYKVNLAVNSLGLLYSILSSIGLGIGSVSYMFALQKGAVGSITSATACYPIITVLLSCLFFNEEMTTRKLIAVIMAVASVYLLTIE